MRGREAFLSGLVAALLIGAVPAHAACTEPVASAHATRGHSARHALPPLAIGDSTMVFAVPHLARLGVDANARACRTWQEGLAMMRQLKRRHRLPSLVIMALGANSWVRPIDVQRALAVLGPQRRLGLVTHRTWFGKPGPDTDTIRRMAQRYPQRTVLMDWVRYAKPHTNWFATGGYDDGLHPNGLGAREFARFLGRFVS